MRKREAAGRECAEVVSIDWEVYSAMLGNLSTHTPPDQTPFWQALTRHYPAERAPRPLIIGAPLRRELRDGEEVFLLTPAPVAAPTLSLKLHKLSGAGRVSVTVCKVDRNGAASPVWWLELASGERSSGKVFAKRLEDVTGCLLSVQLAVRGGSFVYKLHMD